VAAAFAFLGVVALGHYAAHGEPAPLSAKHIAGVQSTGQIVVTVGLANPEKQDLHGRLQAELLGPAGESFGDQGQDIDQNAAAVSYRFTFANPKATSDKLTLRCRFGKQELTLPVNQILVVKAHETALTASQDFFANSAATLRCEVHGVKSMTENIPLAGAEVNVRLRTKDGKIYPLAAVKTGPDGLVEPRFQVPDLPVGGYTLEVATKSTLGEEKLERAIQIKTGAKIMLVTDKPLYQPSQVMHLRALALRPFDLKPVVKADLTFEVEDSKGNKVFKRNFHTSDFGVASVDFQLADEVNQGDYHVRAILGDQQADKTVAVKRYVLPKFKAELTADKRFYLPKETLHADLQADYFFGKPVAGGKIKVTASTFDVQFRDFQAWEGKTDAHGHAKFDIKLPDYFVGQPLQKGDALVRLQVKLTDTANHTETIQRTYPVSDQAIRISLIPEGGRLVPDMKNRVFAVAIYPDGSPAVCDVHIWQGRQAQGKPLASMKTNDAGLAEFQISPKANELRQGQWEQQPVEMLGGQPQQSWLPKSLFDLYAEAKDAAGNQAHSLAEINSSAFGENILLRLDKAIYQGGDTLQVNLRSSAGLPTVYLDLVRGGQTLLSRWLDVKDGKADYRLDLPAEAFGTLEVHAYQMLGTGAIIRDSRVAYVHPRQDLKIEVKADKDVYLPGENAQIRFQVTDADGKPTAAALGVLIVDEAVYALQEMQPGLEKVYFTLQEELLKPQAQVIYHPRETIDGLVLEQAPTADKQQIAQVLLTSIKPKPPAQWQVEPALERRRQVQQQIAQIGWALLNYVANTGKPFQEYDKTNKRWSFRPALLKEIVDSKLLDPALLKEPFGGQWTLDSLAKLENQFTVDHLAKAITLNRIQQLHWVLINYTNANQAKWLKDGRWNFPETVLADAVRSQNLADFWIKDAWDKPIRLEKRVDKRNNTTGWTQLDYHELVSAGPDGKFGTEDNVKLSDWSRLGYAQMWWLDESAQGVHQLTFLGRDRRLRMLGEVFELEMLQKNGNVNRAMMFGAGAPGAGVGGGVWATTATSEVYKAKGNGQPGSSGPGAAAAPTRLREYFPETMLWHPSLITDDQGRAVLPVTFADSITTWRLTASGSSRFGALGGVSAPLRVFQDFFVDLDLPVSLTQNDEVAFPVAVYNYLKTPQTIKLELQREDWFELADGAGFARSLEMQPNQVTAVHFRIRARRIGFQPLIVKAAGSKMSDAVKRTVEVVPDGTKIETVFSDGLSGQTRQVIEIPEHAIPDASRLLVKIYPGVFSQVMEGVEGMLRLPGGCMEQTSSSAYPNVLVVDYIKKARLGSPQILMTAENYLNVGYQRLLTFERPGGGFDWWGSGPPLVWLSAYGLQEFNDMAKVYPIDRGVIDRTQKWLMQQREADGTWSNIGATHSETIAAMGNPKLLLTSYVVWALADSGLRTPEIEKSIAYIRNHVNDAGTNAYVLALAANALASWDAKDDSTLEVLKKLDALKKDLPDWKACTFPAEGQSLTWARGDSLTVETTALTALAMLKTNQFTNSVNQALTYLIKTRQSGGIWGSTSATILSLKALVAGMGGAKQEGKAEFAIRVNGKEVAQGEVTEQNADVLQSYDLKEHTQTGRNEVEIQVKGSTNLMYQIVGRHFEPWKREPATSKPVLEVAVDYDRTKLSTADLLRARATVRYHGHLPTYQVIVDLGIAPGFTVDSGDFAELVAQKRIQRFSVTARQVILYLGDIKPGDVKTFDFTLKPKFPIKAKTPASVAYEYYTPSNRATARPVELTVVEK
jgi:hypothetical protein